MSTRLLRFVNLSIAAVLLLAIAAVYWLAVRPLPKISGELVAPISEMATVRRDARGVPHIEAASWQDAIFLQGYVTAQDRLWQMDTLRRFGGGTLSEVFGPGALSADRLSRSMRMQAIADASVATSPRTNAPFSPNTLGALTFSSTAARRLSARVLAARARL